MCACGRSRVGTEGAPRRWLHDTQRSELVGIFLLDAEASLFQMHREPSLEPPSARRVRMSSPRCALIAVLGTASSVAAHYRPDVSTYDHISPTHRGSHPSHVRRSFSQVVEKCRLQPLLSPRVSEAPRLALVSFACTCEHPQAGCRVGQPSAVSRRHESPAPWFPGRGGQPVLGRLHGEKWFPGWGPWDGFRCSLVPQSYLQTRASACVSVNKDVFPHNQDIVPDPGGSHSVPDPRAHSLQLC